MMTRVMTIAVRLNKNALKNTLIMNIRVMKISRIYI